MGIVVNFQNRPVRFFKEVPVHSIQDYASNYIPNKYFRLFRDVVDILPGEEEAGNTDIGSVRLTLSDPGAYAMLRVINPVTNATLFEKSGRGVVDLLDVPLSSAIAEEAGENENNGKTDSRKCVVAQFILCRQTAAVKTSIPLPFRPAWGRPS